MLATLSFEHSL